MQTFPMNAYCISRITDFRNLVRCTESASQVTLFIFMLRAFDSGWSRATPFEHQFENQRE